jgi:hypothetical protein
MPFSESYSQTLCLFWVSEDLIFIIYNSVFMLCHHLELVGSLVFFYMYDVFMCPSVCTITNIVFLTGLMFWFRRWTALASLKYLWFRVLAGLYFNLIKVHGKITLCDQAACSTF